MKPLALIAALSLSAGAAYAQGADAEMQGVRATAMGGAHRGVGSSNDTIYVNPGGVALGQRYSVDLQYGTSPFSETTVYGVSVVDSKSKPVSGALAYTQERDADDASKLHRIYVGLGYALSPQFGLGIMGRHIRGVRDDAQGEREDLSVFTADVGLSAALGSGLGLGVAVRNLIQDESGLTPLQGSVGVGYAAAGLTLAADAVMDLSDDARRMSWHGGAEYLAGGALPLRLGYSRRPFVRADGRHDDEDLLSGGVGYYTPTGALDGTLTRSLTREQNWSAVVAVKLFF